MSRIRDLKTRSDEKNPFGLIQAETVSCRSVPLQEPVAEMIRTVEEEARCFLRALVATLVLPAHASVSPFAAKRSSGVGRKEPDGRVHASMKGPPRPPEDHDTEKGVEVPAKLWNLLDEIPGQAAGSSCSSISRGARARRSRAFSSSPRTRCEPICRGRKATCGSAPPGSSWRS